MLAGLNVVRVMQIAMLVAEVAQVVFVAANIIGKHHGYARRRLR